MHFDNLFDDNGPHAVEYFAHRDEFFSPVVVIEAFADGRLMATEHVVIDSNEGEDAAHALRRAGFAVVTDGDRDPWTRDAWGAIAEVAPLR